MAESKKSHLISFSEIVKRVKEFRHVHCNCSPDEDIPLGFLAEMSHALGHETSFNLVKNNDPEGPNDETRLSELKRALGNFVRFVENDGGIVSDNNMEFLKTLLNR